MGRHPEAGTKGPVLGAHRSTPGNRRSAFSDWLRFRFGSAASVSSGSVPGAHASLHYIVGMGALALVPSLHCMVRKGEAGECLIVFW